MLILDLFRLELFTECRRRGLNFGTTFKSSHLLPLNLVSVLSQDDNTLIHGFGQGDYDGSGQPTASPMLTAIMSGGVGISGRELYKYR